MPMAPADRIAFSLYQATAPAKIKGILAAQAAIAAQITADQATDTANDNLFTPVNAMINLYQAEFNVLDGNVRTTITEQDISDSANKKLQNHFFPNDTTQVVPSLSAIHNVWPYLNPFALSFGVGLNYLQVYPSTVTKEGDDITSITSQITAATGAYTDFELTTGTTPNPGTCSISMYTTQADCLAHSGIWTPGSGSSPSPAIALIKTNLVTAVNTLITFLNTEAGLIVTTDTTSPNQANNAAAVSNINTVIIPALNTWLALPDFEATGTGPSKLHSTNLATLTTALSNRTTFIATRVSQLNTVLGSITQDTTNGNVTASSGLYGKRYGYLVLRLNALNGSLTILSSLQTASNAQTNIIASINANVATYKGVLPTTIFQSNANGTQFISLVDVSFLNPGDNVYVTADSQTEMSMAIKTIVGNAVTLNAPVPAKYTTSSNARLYKDLS